jgi:kumamolisin
MAKNKPKYQSGVTHVKLEGSRRYVRPGSVTIGRCDPLEWAEVTVKVRRKMELPEPNPMKPIDRKEFATKYGANPKDLDAVEEQLKPFGLKATAKSVTSRTVEVAGTVSAMEKAFGVRLFRVQHDQATYRGRVGDIFIPKKLDRVVTAVLGLDTRPMIKRIPRLTSQSAAGATAAPANRLWFFPAELGEKYAFPASEGQGQTVGILEFEGHYDADNLAQFWKLGGNGGPVPVVQVRNVEALPAAMANNPDGTGETMLDVEVVAALVPKAAITIFISQFTERGWVANLDAALKDSPAPTVISVSYSFPEGQTPWTQQGVDSVNDSLKALANAGVTVCVSSGDDGSDDQMGDGMAHVGFPASSPYVLAVGGTALNRHTGAETAWHEGTGVRPQGGSTGGGVSVMNPRPTWQQAININSVNPHDPAGRIVPDVAADSALHTGYRMFGPVSGEGIPAGTSGWQTVGGTSAATPLWAALIARLQQLGKQVGFLTPRLYASNSKTQGKTLGSFACRDITKGTNASGSAEGYSAGPGFDATTGWGSPNGGKLLQAL